jgi:phosphoenolpyruvate carboxykinase (GTP)
VLKWIFERTDNAADAVDTAIGRLPTASSLDTSGLDIGADDLETLLSVDAEGWHAAIPQIREHYAQFGDRLPAQLAMAVDTLEARLS